VLLPLEASAPELLGNLNRRSGHESDTSHVRCPSEVRSDSQDYPSVSLGGGHRYYRTAQPLLEFAYRGLSRQEQRLV
jgi:hypothetical protein